MIFDYRWHRSALRHEPLSLRRGSTRSYESNAAASVSKFVAAIAQTLCRFKASFANSSGIFLGSDFHFDLARPGAALYGVAPVAGKQVLCIR